MISLLLWAGLCFAQEVEEPVPQIYFDRSDTDVPLNITYDGKEILIYGAVQNIEGDPDLIINVVGPRETYIIHKKEHRLGMWINGSQMRFRNVPSFLATFSDARLDTIMLPTERQRYNIGFAEAVPIRGLSQKVTNPQAFVDAFIRLQKRKGNYVLDEDGIKVAGNTLFSARIPLSANIIEGSYEVNIYLLSRGRVVASVTSDLPVYKSGLERWLYDLAMERGFLYGLLALFLAVAVAFLMSRLMRLFQR